MSVRLPNTLVMNMIEQSIIDMYLICNCFAHQKKTVPLITAERKNTGGGRVMHIWNINETSLLCGKAQVAGSPPISRGDEWSLPRKC